MSFRYASDRNQYQADDVLLNSDADQEIVSITTGLLRQPLISIRKIDWFSPPQKWSL
ncbi:MAG TPA: hypothetical protein VFF29_03035 [Bacteroidota bacterium]|nr:hypothetical protein [Bacteroidota bacterium]